MGKREGPLPKHSSQNAAKTKNEGGLAQINPPKQRQHNRKRGATLETPLLNSTVMAKREELRPKRPSPKGQKTKNGRARRGKGEVFAKNRPYTRQGKTLFDMHFHLTNLDFFKTKVYHRP